MKTYIVVCVLALSCFGQDVETGMLPAAWITGGPNCLEIPAGRSTNIIQRFTSCGNPAARTTRNRFCISSLERKRALLVDTGAGESDAGPFTQRLISKWLLQNKRTSISLVVSHSHGHGDHVAGDKTFEGMPNVTLVPATVEAEQKAFESRRGPTSQAASTLATV